MRIDAIVEQLRLLKSIFSCSFDKGIDLGTDHGYIAEKLLKEGICRRVIATDVAAGPLANAESTLKKYVDEGKIELKLSDGLRDVDVDECDFAVLAGIGGDLASRIIEQSLDKALRIPYYVIQAMTEQSKLRNVLSRYMTYLWDYFVLEGGKSYQITVFTTTDPEKQAKSADYDGLFIPGIPRRVLMRNLNEYRDFLTSKLVKIERIIGYIEDGRARGSEQLVGEHREKAAQIRRLLTEIGKSEIL